MPKDKEPAITIRPVKRDELRNLIEVYESAYEGLEEYAYTSRSEVEDYMEWLYDGDAKGMIVAEVDGKIVGFVGVHTGWYDRRLGRTAEIHEVAVLTDWKGKGVGRRLMEAALDYARRRGCAWASLWVGDGNMLAKEWYRRLGFEERGGGYWVRMVKSLS